MDTRKPTVRKATGRNLTGRVTPILSRETHELIAFYLDSLKSRSPSLEDAFSNGLIGARLFHVLKSSDFKKLNVEEFINALLKTTKPLLFAEDNFELKGNGTDWTELEFQLLSRIARIIPDVDVYATSTYNPQKKDLITDDKKPKATLLFVNGALLAGCKADKNRVIDKDEQFNKEMYDQFLIQNLLPSLIYANTSAGTDGAAVTIPVIGGNQFAGDYKVEINDYYFEAIKKLLANNKHLLPNIKHVIITGCAPEKCAIEDSNITLQSTPTYCGLYPQSITKDKNLKTFCCIAGDPVSFPGNDMYRSSPSTSEGGTCAQTNVFEKITREKGAHMTNSMGSGKFLPSKGGTWEGVCHTNEVALDFDQLVIVSPESNYDVCFSVPFKPSNNYNPNYLSAFPEADYPFFPAYVEVKKLHQHLGDGSKGGLTESHLKQIEQDTSLDPGTKIAMLNHIYLMVGNNEKGLYAPGSIINKYSDMQNKHMQLVKKVYIDLINSINSIITHYTPNQLIDLKIQIGKGYGNNDSTGINEFQEGFLMFKEKKIHPEVTKLLDNIVAEEKNRLSAKESPSMKPPLHSG